MVIKDDEDILGLLNIIFQEIGYNIVTSNTGEAAEHIRIIRPDIILLDVRIEGSTKNGPEICKEIKSQLEKRQLPVMSVSAESDLSVIAEEFGADAFIRKPFDIFELLAKVEECLA